MPKAIARNTTLSLLDVISPNRARFGVITNPQPIPAMNPIMRAIDRAVAKLPPMHTEIEKEAALPGVNHYGKITDQPAFTAATLARIAARRKGGAL